MKVLFSVFIFAVMFLGSARADIVDRVAAIVNDEVITLSDIYEIGGEFIEGQLPEDSGTIERRALELEVLEALIMRTLISQEIQNLGLAVTQAEVDQTIDDIARRNNIDREALRREIERGGMSWSEYMDDMRDSIREMKFNQAVIRPRIAIDEDELLDEYRRRLAMVEVAYQVDLGAIVLARDAMGDEDYQQALLDRVQEIRQRVVDGEDFRSVSVEVDEGMYGRQNGSMGVYSQGELIGALDGPAFTTQVGEISAPIVTEQGIFLLYVFERRAEDVVSFEEVRDQILDQVYSTRIDSEIDLWFEQTRRRSALSIKIHSPVE